MVIILVVGAAWPPLCVPGGYTYSPSNGVGVPWPPLCVPDGYTPSNGVPPPLSHHFVYLIVIALALGSRDSSVVRAPDS